jgi:hypothetical protein
VRTPIGFYTIFGMGRINFIIWAMPSIHLVLLHGRFSILGIVLDQAWGVLKIKNYTRNLAITQTVTI